MVMLMRMTLWVLVMLMTLTKLNVRTGRLSLSAWQIQFGLGTPGNGDCQFLLAALRHQSPYGCE